MNRTKRDWSHLPSSDEISESYKALSVRIELTPMTGKSFVPEKLTSAVNGAGHFPRGGLDDVDPTGKYRWGTYYQSRVGSSAYHTAVEKLTLMGYLRPVAERKAPIKFRAKLRPPVAIVPKMLGTWKKPWQTSLPI